MSILTNIYKFIKPELTDAADITATNENWDKVDAELKNMSDDIDDKMSKTGGEFTGVVDTTEYFRAKIDDNNFIMIGKSNNNQYVISINNNGEWYEVIRLNQNGSISGSMLMPKTGGGFTEYVDILNGVPFDVKAKNGNRLRLIGDKDSNNVYMHVLKADGTFVTDIIAVDTATGSVTSTPLMTKSGGTFTGTVTASDTNTDWYHLRNICVTANDGVNAVSTGRIVMVRK